MAKSVLIVDDIPFVRKTLNEILTQAHYNVVGEAADGGQAIELFIKRQPDIVTMDIVMPSMSGLEATKKILLLEASAKVIIISAMGTEDLVMEAINAGAKDFIQKPFTAQDILRSIERIFVVETHTTLKTASKEKWG